MMAAAAGPAVLSARVYQRSILRIRSLTIAAGADSFTLPGGQPAAEQALVGAPDATVRMASLRGVDAAQLILADAELLGCLFTGTVHLDQARLEGSCSLDGGPARHPLAARAPGAVHRAAPSPKKTTGARSSRMPSGTGTWRCSAPSAPARRSRRRCAGRCLRRSRTAGASRERRTSTTARWSCAPTTVPASPAPNADCCTATGCCPAMACAPPGLLHGGVIEVRELPGRLLGPSRCRRAGVKGALQATGAGLIAPPTGQQQAPRRRRGACEALQGWLRPGQDPAPGCW